MTRTWSEAPLPRRQIELISPTLDERIGKYAGVRFLDALLAEVDWSTWEQAYPGGGAGRPPHHPRLMCAAILYGLVRGMHSTRMLEYATEYCVDFQWLLDGRVIDHSTFAKFRTVHGERIKDLFKAINRKAADLKKLSLEEIIIDGTRVRADSDRHGARTAEALKKRLDALDEKLAKALDELEKAREEGGEEAIAQREKEKAALEARKQRDEKALEVAKARDEVKKAKEGKKAHGVRVPVTDPDAHLLENKEGGYAPNYTPVIAVEGELGLIVAERITEQNSESDCLVPLVEQAEELRGRCPNRVLADEGFGAGCELEELGGKGVEVYTPMGKPAGDSNGPTPVAGSETPPEHWDKLPTRGGRLDKSAFRYDALEDVYVCPMGQILKPYRKQTRKSGTGKTVELMEYSGAACGGCPLASRCLSKNAKARTVSRDEYEGRREEVRERMGSEAGQRIYANRAPRVEGAFGTIKAGMKVRRFQRRGLEKVRQDWTWVCLAYNMRKLMGWMGENTLGMAKTRVPSLLKRLFKALGRMWGPRHGHPAGFIGETEFACQGSGNITSRHFDMYLRL
jgi:transposase